jgi:hypothetical protein
LQEPQLKATLLHRLTHKKQNLTLRESSLALLQIFFASTRCEPAKGNQPVILSTALAKHPKSYTKFKELFELKARLLCLT